MSYNMTADSFKSRYPLIRAAGRYKLTVRSVSGALSNQIGEYKIVNFRAIFQHQVSEELKEQILNGTVDVQNLKTASFNIRTGTVPGRDSIVECDVNFVTRKDGQKVLAITSITIPEAVNLSENTWDVFEKKAKEEVETEVASEVTAEGDELQF